ncbi:MAG TPA: protease HtpX [Candidatus Nanopusillus sp.]|nr:protease HtpX [Candidatus Nanopusillus sp.]
MKKLKSYKIINIIKSLLLISAIGVIVYFLVEFLSFILNPGYAKFSALYGLFSAVFYILLGTLLGPKIVLASVGARPLEEHPRYEEVREIVEELSKEAKIPIPKLYYFVSNDINAFATGLTPGNACIAITTGALKYLNREELAGVLGHEIGHIKHFDMMYMTITSVLVGLVSFIANWMIYSLFWSSDERPAWVNIIAILVAILTPIVATIIQLAISREREYLADLFSAELNGGPDGLISAFRKIQIVNTGDIPYNEAIEPLYFVSVEELFSTHPPIEKRIQRLLEVFEQ